jgi:hypothetical protein
MRQDEELEQSNDPVGSEIALETSPACDEPLDR